MKDNEIIAYQIGGEIDKTKVSLRFFGDNLCAEEITRLLKCSPSTSYKKGDILYNEITNTSAWLLSSEKSGESLEHQISDLFSRLNTDLEIWRQLTISYKADLFCGLWINGNNRGTNFPAEILRQITERGLSLDFDIYCLSDEN